jgi:two-component system NtrC family sensor kinase
MIVTRVIAATQLACVVVGSALLTRLWSQTHGPVLLELFGIAAFAGVVTVVGWILLAREHRSALELARSMSEEQRHTATLEQTVESKTTELEEAQRVLQRMWWLGQQITLELNPQRVLERFVEAVSDIAQTDGGCVGLVGEDGKLHMVVGTGLAAGLQGMAVPIQESAMGRVIRSGDVWTVTDLHDAKGELSAEIYSRMIETVTSLAIVPISKRGERIGAVALVTGRARVFTTADLERIESMSDLLSVSLENAELVETLRRTEWRFRTLFRAAPDAVLTVLQSGRIREANDAVRDVTGADPMQVVGREVVELVIPTDRENLRSALDAAFSGSPTRLELTFERNDRGAVSRRLVAVAMSRLPEADPPSVLLVGRDVTNEREMRLRLMETDRLAAVGELVAGVAHEVNNPLSSISAFAQLLLREDGLTPAQRESIEIIKSETLRASQVVKDLLAFARRREPQHELVDLNVVIARTLRLRGYQMTTNKIRVNTDLSPDLPNVAGDARQLQQVCLNLVINAVQAMMETGGGTLSVSTHADGDMVVMDVRDTGPGIAEETRAHIFEPFFTTKDEGQGTGLGLSVSYGIITAHGGTIEAADASSSGTTIRVTLPARVAL